MRRGLRIGITVAALLPSCALAQAPPTTPPPYEPQLLRLSELMGALYYLRGLCGFADAEQWRDRMGALMTGQGLDTPGRERYAGAFNQGYRTFGETYRSCNEKAGETIRTYLSESAALVKELDSRYGR